MMARDKVLTGHKRGQTVRILPLYLSANLLIHQVLIFSECCCRTAGICYQQTGHSYTYPLDSQYHHYTFLHRILPVRTQQALIFEHTTAGAWIFVVNKFAEEGAQDMQPSFR